MTRDDGNDNSGERDGDFYHFTVTLPIEEADLLRQQAAEAGIPVDRYLGIVFAESFDEFRARALQLGLPEDALLRRLMETYQK